MPWESQGRSSALFLHTFCIILHLQSSYCVEYRKIHEHLVKGMSWFTYKHGKSPTLHHTVSPWKVQGSEKLDYSESPNVYEDNAFTYSSHEYNPWAWFPTCSHHPSVPIPSVPPLSTYLQWDLDQDLKWIYRIKKKNPLQAKERLETIDQCLWKYLDHFSWEGLQQTKQSNMST